MATLTRGTKKLEEEAMPSAEPGSDGDKLFCLWGFNEEQSIERCWHLERRGTKFKVKCGLELCWAKLNLDHGRWYPYLYKAGIEPSKAQRRMKVARDFMQWAGVTDVVRAIELAYSKSCKLQDFADYIRGQLNLNEFIDKGYSPPGTKQHILGVSLKELRQLIYRIGHTIRTDYRNWNATERDEVKQTLQLVAEEPLILKREIEELEQRPPKEQIRGMVGKHNKRRFEQNDTPERKERIIQWLRGKENEQNSEVIEKVIADL